MMVVLVRASSIVQSKRGVRSASCPATLTRCELTAIRSFDREAGQNSVMRPLEHIGVSVPSSGKAKVGMRIHT